MDQPQPQVEYVGFWARVLAAIIDTIAVGLLLAVVSYVLGLRDLITLDAGGSPVFHAEALGDTAINRLLYAAVIVGFWSWKMATPGKMVINAVIVDASTFGKPTLGQLIGRYL
ncbi:MAG TPA: RDD family protein, partial [Nevskiaceae bacterium]|nr:RDD family protein [Nevskiaceae bacterium]